MATGCARPHSHCEFRGQMHLVYCVPMPSTGHLIGALYSGSRGRECLAGAPHVAGPWGHFLCVCWVGASTSPPRTYPVVFARVSVGLTQPLFQFSYLLSDCAPFWPVTSICPLGILACPISSRILSELLPSSCELPHFQIWSRYSTFIAIWSFWGRVGPEQGNMTQNSEKTPLSHCIPFKGLGDLNAKPPLPPSLCSRPPTPFSIVSSPLSSPSCLISFLVVVLPSWLTASP